jgi:hypothetical protein
MILFHDDCSPFRSSAWFSIGTSAHSFSFSAHETKYRCSINCYQLLYTKSFPCNGIPDSLPYIASISCFRRSLHYGHYWAFYTTTNCIRSLCCTYCCIFSRGTREGWLLLTVETEANGEFRKYILYERDPSMVGSLGSPNRYKRFLFFLGCYCRPTCKIFFSSSKTISLHLSPSPSKLARQSCSVASPLICVSDAPPCSMNRKRRDLNVSKRTASGILARYS